MYEVVKPYLRYAIRSWYPYYIKDINELEKVQRLVAVLMPLVLIIIGYTLYV